jgi:hypothetical protein
MKKIVIVILAFFTCFFCLLPSYSADGFGLEKTAVQAGYEIEGTSASLSGRVQVVISAFLGLMALVFFGLTLYGGIIWLTARGKEDAVEKAKGILEAAIIGLIVVVFSYAIATFVLNRLTGVSQSGEVYSCNFMDFDKCFVIYSEADKQRCESEGGDMLAGPCVNY